MIFVSNEVDDVEINDDLFVDIMTLQDISSLTWNSSRIKNSFEGATLLNKFEREITSEKDATDLPMTDHHIIYVKINGEKILFSNNLSLLSKRGYTNNGYWKITVNQINDLNDEIIPHIFEFSVC